MTIQMRKGWVRCRNEVVTYAEPNSEGSLRESHPWRLRRNDYPIRNDGAWRTDGRPGDTWDVVELLDPWDERIDEEHRERRFLVGECFDGNKRSPCVFDRKTRKSIAYERLSVAEEMCCALNLDHGRVSTVIGSWSQMVWFSVRGLATDSADENLHPVKHETFKVVDQPTRTSRTLQAGSWIVWAEKTGNGDPVVVVESKSSSPSSIKEARAFAEAILEVCREIEED